MALFAFISLIAITLKVIALIDLFRTRKSFSPKKKVFLCLLILIFPPAPLIYLIIVNIKKSDRKNYDTKDLDSDGLL